MKKDKKMLWHKVQTNNVAKAAYLCKIMIGQKEPRSFLQPGARKIGVIPRP